MIICVKDENGGGAGGLLVRERQDRRLPRAAHAPTSPLGGLPCHPCASRCSYAALIADWPVVVLGLCTVLIVVCALVGVLVPELPDFSDPLLVRRTEPGGCADFLQPNTLSENQVRYYTLHDIM